MDRKSLIIFEYVVLFICFGEIRDKTVHFPNCIFDECAEIALIVVTPYYYYFVIIYTVKRIRGMNGLISYFLEANE